MNEPRAHLTEQVVKSALDNADSGYPDHSHDKFVNYQLAAGETAWNPANSYLSPAPTFVGPATVTYILAMNGEVYGNWTEFIADKREAVLAEQQAARIVEVEAGLASGNPGRVALARLIIQRYKLDIEDTLPLKRPRIDPDVVLAQLRDAGRQLDLFDPAIHRSDELIEMYDEQDKLIRTLDHWLSSGGHLPMAWVTRSSVDPRGEGNDSTQRQRPL